MDWMNLILPGCGRRNRRCKKNKCSTFSLSSVSPGLFTAMSRALMGMFLCLERGRGIGGSREIGGSEVTKGADCPITD